MAGFEIDGINAQVQSPDGLEGTALNDKLSTGGHDNVTINPMGGTNIVDATVGNYTTVDNYWGDNVTVVDANSSDQVILNDFGAGDVLVFTTGKGSGSHASGQEAQLSDAALTELLENKVTMEENLGAESCELVAKQEMGTGAITVACIGDLPPDVLQAAVQAGAGAIDGRFGSDAQEVDANDVTVQAAGAANSRGGVELGGG